MRKWDFDSPDTLNDSLIARFISIFGLTRGGFECVRDEYLRQAQCRLDDLRLREDLRQGRIEVPLPAVAQKLQFLIRHVGGKTADIRSGEEVLNLFEGEQRRALYQLLDEIHEHIPWRGFLISEGYDALRRNGMMPE